MDLADFFHMGGYAKFVWSSYVLTFLVIGLNIWGAVRAHAAAKRHALRRLEMGATASSEPAARDNRPERLRPEPPHAFSKESA